MLSIPHHRTKRNVALCFRSATHSAGTLLGLGKTKGPQQCKDQLEVHDGESERSTFGLHDTALPRRYRMSATHCRTSKSYLMVSTAFLSSLSAASAAVALASARAVFSAAFSSESASAATCSLRPAMASSSFFTRLQLACSP